MFNQLALPIIGLNHSPIRRLYEPDEGMVPQEKTDELVERAYEDYCRAPAGYGTWFPKEMNNIFDSPVMAYDYSLNPSQIDVLLAKLISSRKTPISNQIRLCQGLYVSCMIQKSYSTGHYDQFALNTGYTDLAGICCGLTGTPERRMKIAILGDVGRSFADSVKYVDLDLSGKFNYRFMNNSQYSTTIARGHNNDTMSLARSTFDCKITVVDKNTYDRLSLIIVPSNTITLINDAGEILEQKDLRCIQ